jgi:hypothetical protein
VRKAGLALAGGGWGEDVRAKITWRSDEAGHLVTGEEEFRHALAEAQQDAVSRPFVAEVTREDAGSLCIGLGGAVSVLSYVGVSGRPPYFTSQGSARRRYGDAVAAVRHFCEHGELSPQVDWVEV